MNWTKENKNRGYEGFEARQQELTGGVQALLVEGLEPRQSDEDRAFLLDQTCISESVEGLQGDAEDQASTATQLCEAVREYRTTYGRDPEPGQLAAVGAALKAYPKTWKQSGGTLISENVAAAATKSDNFTARPQFMTLAALLPLKTIAGQLGYPVGFVPGDVLEIHEIDKAGDRYDFEDVYQTGTLNKVVPMSASGSGDDARSFFHLAYPLPVTRGKIVLVINGQRVAEDDGDGQFQLPAAIRRAVPDVAIDLVDSSIDYWNDTNSEMDIEFSGNLPESMDCHLEIQIDIERYPQHIPQMGFSTRSLKLKPCLNMLTAGMSLQAMLRAMRSLKTGLPDLSFRHLVYWLTASIDRQIIQHMNVYAHKWSGDYKYAVAGAHFDQWPADAYSSSLASFMSAMDQEIIGRQNDENLKSDTEAQGGATIWIGGEAFRHAALMALSALTLPISPDLNASVYYRNRPCYLGEIHGRRLFYAPDATMTGICKGMRPSESAFISGMVSPMTLHTTGMDIDLKQFCVLRYEDIRHFTPDAGLYLNTVPIQKGPEIEDGLSLYNPLGMFHFIK